MACEPGDHLGVLVGGIVVDDGVDGLPGRHGVLDGVEEADELLVAVARHVAADDGAVEDIERGEERGGAVPLVVVRHRGEATLLQRQAGLGAVERLDLALLVDRQDHGMRRRIDVEPDDVAHLRRELRIVGELEGPDPMRLQPVRAPDALDVGKAHARRLRHRAAGPVGRLARRFAEGQGNDPLGHFRPEGLDPRWPGLVAQKAIDALRAEPFLPAPHRRLALGRGAHDRHRAKPLGGGQHDPGAPNVLLWAVAVRDDGFKPVTVRGGQFDYNPGAHPQDSHARSPEGIHIRTRPSHSIH